MDRVQATGGKVRKRKAENQDNERLSKRLSLLNLGLYFRSSYNYNKLIDRTERNGQKLYVPVEQPTVTISTTTLSRDAKPPTKLKDDDMMQVDDTKHKVYIYDLDAELSDSESDDGKLVFLPDIEKHLRESRIPPSILANNDGELAGNTQLVLYNVPSSLSVPEEHDSVRKAIIETRARARAQQDQRLVPDLPVTQTGYTQSLDADKWRSGTMNGVLPGAIPITQEAMNIMNATSYANNTGAQQAEGYDPDAMDLG